MIQIRFVPWWLLAALVCLALPLALAVHHGAKPLPEGLSVATPLRPTSEAVFLTDVTYVDAAGVQRTEQTIFDDIFAHIAEAEKLVLLDMFLFNDFAGEAGDEEDGFRPLSAELETALVDRKRQRPSLRIILITDPINTLYGGLSSPPLEALRAAGIEVIVTDLAPLRDSNPLWSAGWRICCRWLGSSDRGGWLPNPLGPGRIPLRSHLALLNFKANHRKTLVVDRGEEWLGLVTSANPHDASSRHTNVALRFEGVAALDLLETERAVAAMSGVRLAGLPTVAGLPSAADAPRARERRPPAMGEARVQILTEGAIRDALLATVSSAGVGDRLDVAVFYLSHRPLLRALVAAHDRGARVRVLLDPNEDAFGRKKNGIPNRPVAAELHRVGVPVRWCDTHGEQCHTKLLLARPAAGGAELIVGSANFTRRNLDDLNLETDARLLASAGHPAIRAALDFFEASWHNESGRQYSLPYEAYADESRWRAWLGWWMETTGLSTF